MKKKIIKYIFFAIITLCFFGIFVKKQYASDTYFVFSNTNEAVIRQFFCCGRFVTGIVAGLCIGIFKLSEEKIYILSYVFAIICTIISLYKLSNLIKKETKNCILSIIFSTLVVINIFSFELYIYIEKGIMMLSVLMSILAVEQIYKHLENKKWKHFSLSMFYLLIATCSYQGTIGIFVSLSLLYIIKYSRTTKEFLINNIKVLIIYGIPSIINFLIVRFANYNYRVEGKIVLLESIRKIAEGIQNIFINTYNLFPKYLFSIYLLAITVFIIYKTIFSKEKTKDKILKILGIVYIVAGTLAVTILPQILQNTEEIWFVARSTYPIASIVGILLIYAFNQFDIKKIEEITIILFCLIFIIIQLKFFENFAKDGYIVNDIDKQETVKVIKQIEEYEKQSGQQINKIAIYQDKNIKYTYSGILTSGDINARTLSKGWGARVIINYYSGKTLQLTQGNKKIQELFIKQNWDKYDERQIIFENDIMHLCIY